MDVYKKNWLKFVLGIFACLLIRIIPFRPPNVEPILATQMPFAKAYGGITGFVFAFLSIALYDIVTGTLGQWSLITATAYAVLGIGAAFYFKNRKANSWNFAKFAVAGTLFFDAATGLTIGPLFFGQPFMGALVGQIPFTLWHLLGNVSFALVLSPAIYRFVIENKKLEFHAQAEVFTT
jgi:energy-coupling factor transport system substrate-specific component